MRTSGMQRYDRGNGAGDPWVDACNRGWDLPTHRFFDSSTSAASRCAGFVSSFTNRTMSSLGFAAMDAAVTGGADMQVSHRQTATQVYRWILAVTSPAATASTRSSTA